MIPFLCHQFAVPAENCVGCHDRGQFPQCLEAESLAFDRQKPPLVIDQEYPFLAKLNEQSLDFGTLEIDDLLLSPLDHAAQNGQQQLPRLQNEAHGVLQMLNVGESVSLWVTMAVVNRLNSVVAKPRQPQLRAALTVRLSFFTIRVVGSMKQNGTKAGEENVRSMLSLMLENIWLRMRLAFWRRRRE